MDDFLVSRAEQGNEKNLYLPFFLLCTNFKGLTTLNGESPHWSLLLFSNMRWFPSPCFHPAPQDAPEPPSPFLHRVLPKADPLRKAAPTGSSPGPLQRNPFPFLDAQLGFATCPGLYSPTALGLPKFYCLAAQNLRYTG